MSSRRLARALALVAVCTSFAAAAAPTYHTDLPKVASQAGPKQARDARIEAHRQKYLAKARAGTLGAMTPKKRAEDARVATLASQLQRDLKRRKSDRPIVIVFEGPGGAGKSSTIRRLTPAFRGLPVKVTHTGPPPANEKDHWTKRHIDALPAKGTVGIFDRSWYGRVIYDPYYGMASKKVTRKSLKEINHLEGMLAGQMDIVKIYLSVSGDRQAKTIAKREVSAPERLGVPDYVEYGGRKAIRKLTLRAIDATKDTVPWHVVSMDDRAAGMEKVFKILRERLL